MTLVYRATFAAVRAALVAGATAGLLPVSLSAIAVSAAASGAPASEHALAYRIESESSKVRVFTGSSGLLGFLGHEHVIAVPRLAGGAAIDSTDATRFILAIEAPADSLRVVDEDEDREAREKIEHDMKEDVLESAKYPVITLQGLGFQVSQREPASAATAWGTYAGRLALVIRLHGVEQKIEVPIALELDRHYLRARGKFSIRHSDFGMERKKVAGVVNVAEKLEIEYDVIGRAGEPAAR